MAEFHFYILPEENFDVLRTLTKLGDFSFYAHWNETTTPERMFIDSDLLLKAVSDGIWLFLWSDAYSRFAPSHGNRVHPTTCGPMLEFEPSRKLKVDNDPKVGVISAGSLSYNSYYYEPGTLHTYSPPQLMVTIFNRMKLHLQKKLMKFYVLRKSTANSKEKWTPAPVWISKRAIEGLMYEKVKLSSASGTKDYKDVYASRDDALLALAKQ